MLAELLTTAGLILGMIGVVLIFFWGPPLPNFNEFVGRSIASGTVLADDIKVQDIIESNLRRKKRHQVISSLGLVLIFLGFAVQLLAIWVT